MKAQFLRIDSFLKEYGFQKDLIFEAVGMMFQFVSCGKISKEIWARKVMDFYHSEIKKFNEKPKTEQVEIL